MDTFMFLVLVCKVDRNIKDSQGRTALDYFGKIRKEKLENFLSEKEKDNNFCQLFNYKMLYKFNNSHLVQESESDLPIISIFSEEKEPQVKRKFLELKEEDFGFVDFSHRVWEINFEKRKKSQKQTFFVGFYFFFPLFFLLLNFF